MSDQSNAAMYRIDVKWENYQISSNGASYNPSYRVSFQEVPRVLSMGIASGCNEVMTGPVLGPEHMREIELMIDEVNERSKENPVFSSFVSEKLDLIKKKYEEQEWDSRPTP